MIEDRAPINTESRYRIVNAARNDSGETRVKPRMPSELRSISASDWVTVAVLCFVNLINYMDRYTIPGESSLADALPRLGMDLGRRYQRHSISFPYIMSSKGIIMLIGLIASP